MKEQIKCALVVFFFRKYLLGKRLLTAIVITEKVIKFSMLVFFKRVIGSSALSLSPVLRTRYDIIRETLSYRQCYALSLSLQSILMIDCIFKLLFL